MRQAAESNPPIDSKGQNSFSDNSCDDDDDNEQDKETDAINPDPMLEAPAKNGGVLPRAASVQFEITDPARVHLFDPIFRAIGDRASRLRRYQADRLNLQLVYTVATLLALALFLVFHA